MAVGCGLCQRVWLRHLGVIGSHEFGDATWMWFVPTCLAVKVECVWYPGVWPWTFDVIGTHEFGDGSGMWFVPACVAVAVGRGWLRPRVEIADECGWFPRLWW